LSQQDAPLQFIRCAQQLRLITTALLIAFGTSGCDLPWLGLGNPADTPQLSPSGGDPDPVDPSGDRVTTGLIVYYPFNEGGGTTAGDQSGTSPALDLTLSGEVEWLAGGAGVRLLGGKIGSEVPAGKVHSALTATNASTFEVWTVPANLTQSGPARLISIGATTAEQDFVLGQDGNGYQVRLKHSAKDDLARPRLATNGGAALDIQHIVHTYDGAVERLYINGVEQSANVPLSGDYSVWDAANPLNVGNEGDMRRPYSGNIYLVAVYDRALDASEILQNFGAGPIGRSDANLPPSVFAGDDLMIFQPAVTDLRGFVVDDGLPSDPGQVTLEWSQLDGPGIATFFDPTAPNTSVGFDQPGVYTLRLTANDGERSASDDLVVTVSEFELNNRPRLTGFAFSMAEGDAVSVQVLASDPDGQNLFFSASGLPPFASLVDNGDGSATLTLEPGYDDAGSYSLAIRVSDDGQPPMFAESTVEVTVVDVDRPPEIVPVPPVSVVATTQSIVTLETIDFDADQAAILALDLPDFAVLVPLAGGTAELRLTPGAQDVGSYTATLLAYDVDNVFSGTLATLDIEVVPAGARTMSGLVAYYPFTEQAGTTVADLSGAGTPMDLEITGDVTWLGNTSGVQFNGGRVGTSATATKLIDALTASGSSTFEIWAFPADLVQNGPARLISIGQDTALQNFVLGQNAANYQVRLLHSGKDSRARPRLETSGGVALAVQHVVHTFDGSVERLYIDGVEQPETVSASGDLSNWLSDQVFSIGNEATSNRPFRGEIYLVAVYDRVLDESEVQQNYLAGPFPATPPP